MEEIYAKLTAVFTREQLEQLADLCARMQARAVERGCDQSVTIHFNDRGYPRHLNGTDNVVIVKPNYKPE